MNFTTDIGHPKKIRGEIIITPIHTLRVLAMRLLVGMVATLALASPGRADIIFQSTSFSFATPLSNPSFEPFSLSFGRLDSVDVSIRGALSFEVLLEAGESVTPVLNFDVVGTVGGGYDFSSPAYFILPAQTNPNTDCGPAPCPPVVAAFATPFSFGFKLDARSDLVGLALATDVSGIVPPGQIDARRADFIEGVVPLDIIEMQIISPMGFVPLGGLRGNGTIQVTYNYSPPIPITPVISDPEPATAALFALAPALLLFRRRGAGRRRDRQEAG